MPLLAQITGSLKYMKSKHIGSRITNIRGVGVGDEKVRSGGEFSSGGGGIVAEVTSEGGVLEGEVNWGGGGVRSNLVRGGSYTIIM